MPAKHSSKTPSYRLHRPTGQALVELSGKRIYLGKHGTPDSLQRYAREVSAWQANGRRLVVPVEDLTVAELCDRFMDHAAGYYVKSGRQTSEFSNFGYAIKVLIDLYADLAVEQFGVTELRVIRDRMIQTGWTRKSINRAMGRIRHIVRWGVGRAMVKAGIVQALEAVEPLKRGRCQASEAPPVKPVPESMVDATLPFMSPTVRAMVELQRLTGMRSGEVIIMRGCDLDTSGATWVFIPKEHKTEHHDCPRPIYLGKRAQGIVGPFLKADVSAYLFSPAESEVERLQRRHAARRTAMNCGNRPGSSKCDSPVRPPGDLHNYQIGRRWPAATS